MTQAFLEALSEEETEALMAVGKRRSYGPHVTLFHQGDEAGAVILVFSGRVKVATLSEAGREASWPSGERGTC
jgi:CRP-like cAMP-binding protein